MSATTLICPACEAEAFLCEHEHTNGSGPHIHCTEASLHTFSVFFVPVESRHVAYKEGTK